jgi:hypothetical protein
VVPMHYDLIEGNTADPEAFARLAGDALPGGRVTVLERMAETPLGTLLNR